MTDKQINKAVVVLRGWRFVEDNPYYEPYWEDPKGNMLSAYLDWFPNYAGCLNAMHDAEEWLMREDLHAYGCYVVNLYDKHSNVIHVTARMKAEEFLKVLGEWEEEA
jgi:hypothetical protein